MTTKSTSTSTRRRQWTREGLREPERLAGCGGPAVDVGEEARELDEQRRRSATTPTIV